MDYFVCVTFHFFLSKNYKFVCPLGPKLENKLSYISTVEIWVQQKYHQCRGSIGKVEISVQLKYQFSGNISAVEISVKLKYISVQLKYRCSRDTCIRPVEISVKLKHQCSGNIIRRTVCAVLFVSIRCICAVEMSSVQRKYQYSGNQHKISVQYCLWILV